MDHSQIQQENLKRDTSPLTSPEQIHTHSHHDIPAQQYIQSPLILSNSPLNSYTTPASATFIPHWPSMLDYEPLYIPYNHDALRGALASSEPADTGVATEQGPDKNPQVVIRRALSDDDRFKMCQYHERNPQLKQRHIGGEFSVIVQATSMTC